MNSVTTLAQGQGNPYCELFWECFISWRYFLLWQKCISWLRGFLPFYFGPEPSTSHVCICPWLGPKIRWLPTASNMEKTEQNSLDLIAGGRSGTLHFQSSLNQTAIPGCSKKSLLHGASVWKCYGRWDFAISMLSSWPVVANVWSLILHFLQSRWGNKLQTRKMTSTLLARRC